MIGRTSHFYFHETMNKWKRRIAVKNIYSSTVFAIIGKYYSSPSGSTVAISISGQDIFFEICSYFIDSLLY
jgi:hypothetical protein